MAEVRDLSPVTSQIVASPISDYSTTLSRLLSSSNAPRRGPSVDERSLSETSPEALPMETRPSDVRQRSPAPASETTPGAIERPEHNTSPVIERGDPTQTDDGKYCCKMDPKCADLVFGRKCEWRRHRDKHVRPYRCLQADCSKLQGFTYPGGLRRHEREVHGKYVSSKEKLQCTVFGCTRQSGKEFTRKENLNDHIRRVHKSTGSDRSQLQDIANAATERAGIPPAQLPDTDDADDSSTATTGYSDLAKRRRLDTRVDSRSIPHGLVDELQRLKADGLERDRRICELEERRVQAEARLKHLEDKLSELKQQT